MIIMIVGELRYFINFSNVSTDIPKSLLKIKIQNVIGGLEGIYRILFIGKSPFTPLGRSTSDPRTSSPSPGILFFFRLPFRPLPSLFVTFLETACLSGEMSVDKYNSSYTVNVLNPLKN